MDNYEKAIEIINSKTKFVKNPNLSGIKNMLGLLSNPQDKLKFIHVAGTNGKGTTCTLVSSVLRKAGYKVGLFTSPFVENFTERFKINDVEITENELVEQINLLEEVNESAQLSYFEYITALAFNYFYQNNCDVVVLEVGMGGKFDATNVIECPLVAAICSISFDHTQILGNTLKEIAHRKAGIIKQNSDVVLYPVQDNSVLEVINEVCAEKNARLNIASTDFKIIKEDLKGSEILIENEVINIPFSGYHQILNSCVAYEIIKLLKQKNYKISLENIKKGFLEAKIYARTELVCENPAIILDGSHNPDGAKALKYLIDKHLSNREITAIIGMMSDKDCDEYLKIIAPSCSRIITTKPQIQKAIDENILAEKARVYCDNVESFESVKKAIEQAIALKKPIIICGSLYLMGEARKILLTK